MKLSDFFIAYMMLISLVGYVPLFIQGAHIIDTQDSSNLSEGAFIFAIIIVLSWLVYGFYIRDHMIVINSTMGLYAGSFLLLIVYAFQK